MTNTFDPIALQNAVADVHRAGVPGVFAEVRHGDRTWCGAAGFADIDTGRLVTPEMRHRVGSLTKTFTAAAVLQLVDEGELALDTPIGQHLPRLVPGDRGAAITIRMLINHTSGLAEYLPYAYPSLAGFPEVAKTTPQSLDDHRYTRFHAVDLIVRGVSAPATGAPGGEPGTYSNTNYLLLGQLLETVTGIAAEKHITRAVIERAGLHHTELATEPTITGPHSKHYESWFGMIDPPRDYSVYDMSFVGPAASLISTTGDLNRFYRLLLAGEIISASALAEMQRTVPVTSFEGKPIDYGLGLHRFTVPERGIHWGHDGSVWGGGAVSMISADGERQLTIAVNLQRWNRLDASGRPRPHPIDAALAAFVQAAL
ncbi:class A beta-lactamase-related serine hydrolase [Nocardia yunnanensis]|uniref:Class A beta-lactamase-related serine hydrolase n=1 Tax=Nocardia yunnanensis TaxID=2382165 RepID=A0A386ZG05_9NOCA|nr:serine hydrolase domain-containing protein [Nocardia yunnanensis]AYF76832.1 class A beta-lactamase-related serine hydrolase [Nocardia yunnanensis]